jgi:predicted class III extradiol MEMO1 family dioxygenase
MKFSAFPGSWNAIDSTDERLADCYEHSIRRGLIYLKISYLASLKIVSTIIQDANNWFSQLFYI